MALVGFHRDRIQGRIPSLCVAEHLESFAETRHQTTSSLSGKLDSTAFEMVPAARGFQVEQARHFQARRLED